MEDSSQQLDVARNLTCAGIIAQDKTLLADGRTMMADAVAHARQALCSDEDGDRRLTSTTHRQQGCRRTPRTELAFTAARQRTNSRLTAM